MASRALEGDVLVSGMNQKDLANMLLNIMDLINELQTDHALFQLAVDGIVAKLDGDGGITDTDYEAVHGVGGSGAALPATLTNTTAITNLRS